MHARNNNRTPISSRFGLAMLLPALLVIQRRGREISRQDGIIPGVVPASAMPVLAALFSRHAKHGIQLQ
ncbi:MAG TPA: hypothetical protein VN043_11560 [Rhodanobacter sp.]|nr:hypothetical protein [Rhodanobacter sp.]